ncbi:MAG: metallophosphoesterase, partial [Candidatus Aminicenantes bacterium]|nr:metallophosphoesterase [Candidatus Aminicenantes bacterium]
YDEEESVMFLLDEIIYAAPLIVYALVRIGTLIPRRAGRVAWAGVSLLLLSGFPVAERLSHRGAEGVRRLAMLAGYDAAVYLLYLVLTVLAVDLVAGAARLSGLLSKDRARAPRVRALRLAAGLGLPVLVVLAGVWNFRTLRVKTYDIDVPRKSSPLSELKIAFAADFHLGDATSPGFMDRFAARVNALEPDVVLIGGDVLEGDRPDERLDHFAAGFRRLRSRFGVFGVLGNHEGYAGGRPEFFAQAGIRMLRDEVVRVGDAFVLAGRNDRRFGPRKPVADLLAGTPDDLPVILLDHRPVDLENVSRTIADIQLSGHSHHGQLFPVNFVTKHRYELSWGYKKKGKTHVFVTSGVQLWGPPIRTAGHSEILLIRVALRGPAPAAGPGCTAFILQGRGALFLARNHDGPAGDGLVFVNKRGLAKHAFEPGLGGGTPKRWTSKYGSVTFNRFGREFPLGGLNEAGLSVEGLAGPAEYAAVDGRSALSELEWIQYQLDTAGSVKDVLSGDEDVRVARLLFDVHYFVADRKGNAAVVAFVAGKRTAVTGGYLTVPVLANDAYADALRALELQSGVGVKRRVPWESESADRFVKAATFLRDFEWLGQAPVVDDAFVALRSVEQADTRWSIAYNLPRRLVFFKTRLHRRYKLIALDRLDFSRAGPARMLPIETEEAWSLDDRFADYDPERNRMLVESAFARFAEFGGNGPPPTPALIRAMASHPETAR